MGVSLVISGLLALINIGSAAALNAINGLGAVGVISSYYVTIACLPAGQAAAQRGPAAAPLVAGPRGAGGQRRGPGVPDPDLGLLLLAVGHAGDTGDDELGEFDVWRRGAVRARVLPRVGADALYGAGGADEAGLVMKARCFLSDIFTRGGDR